MNWERNKHTDSKRESKDFASVSCAPYWRIVRINYFSLWRKKEYLIQWVDGNGQKFHTQLLLFQIAHELTYLKTRTPNFLPRKVFRLHISLLLNPFLCSRILLDFVQQRFEMRAKISASPNRQVWCDRGATQLKIDSRQKRIKLNTQCKSPCSRNE